MQLNKGGRARIMFLQDKVIARVDNGNYEKQLVFKDALGQKRPVSDYNSDSLSVQTKNVCKSFCFDCPNNFTELRLTPTITVNRSMLVVGDDTFRINESNYRMLCALHRNSGMPLSRAFLLKYVWRNGSNVPNNVNVMVSELRTLLSNSELEIITVRGKGYQLLTKRVVSIRDQTWSQQRHR